MANPQGTKRDPKYPQSPPVKAPVTAAQVKQQVQRAIDRKEAALTRAKPAQKVTGRQDWRKG
jgi:hypothetical protein